MGHGASLPAASPTRVVDDRHRTLICRFCGGASCRHEDYRTQRASLPPPPLRGLHSSLVTHDIIACQRPSSRLIREHDLPAQFRALRVGAVVNLQSRGEHPLCGDGILASTGFSYAPEELHPVFCYNYGWTDMGVPPHELMLRVVQVVAHHVHDRGERVAIHCHAGLGRTGITAASWLLYDRPGTAPDDAIALVRARRPGTVQTAAQQRFVREFAAHVERLRQAFPSPPVTLREALRRQRLYLRGDERRTFRLVPRPVAVLCAHLREAGAAEALASPAPPGGRVARALRRRLDADDYYRLGASEPRVLARLLYEWFDEALSEAAVRLSDSAAAAAAAAAGAEPSPDDLEGAPACAMATLGEVASLLRGLGCDPGAYELAARALTRRDGLGAYLEALASRWDEFRAARSPPPSPRGTIPPPSPAGAGAAATGFATLLYPSVASE